MGDSVEPLKDGIGAISDAKDIFDEERDRKSDKNKSREYGETIEDRGNRREATYRQNRQMLLNALGSYYAKQGISMPEGEGLPGAGTSKQLPFEAPLYSGSKDFYKGNRQEANMQPSQPNYAVLPQDGTAGETEDMGNMAEDIRQTSGTPKDVAPTENSQQAAAKALDPLFSTQSPEAMSAFENWRKRNGKS
jgi:hypothetical protein